MCLDVLCGYKHFPIVLCSTYLMLPETKEQFFEINVKFLLWISVRAQHGQKQDTVSLEKSLQYAS